MTTTSSQVSTPWGDANETGVAPVWEEANLTNPYLWERDIWYPAGLPSFNFTFGIPMGSVEDDFPTVMQAQLGLGKNSSFLEFFKGAGYIGARAYSVFWGRLNGPAEQRTSGALILGGYDKSFIDSSTGTQISGEIMPSEPGVFGCSTGLQLPINDLQLNWRNGTNTSIIKGSSLGSLVICLEPSFPGLMSLPHSHWDAFKKLAGGKALEGDEGRSTFMINPGTMMFEKENIYDGDLTIEMFDDVRFRIPNTDLVVPPAYISSNGTIIANSSIRNIVIKGLDEGRNDALMLGKTFLSSAYLLVNHDKNSFTLWAALTSANGDGIRSNGSLVAVASNGNETTEFCEGSFGGNSNPTTSSLPFPSSSSDLGRDGKELSKGSIAGIAIGSAIAFALVAGIAWKLWRTKRNGSRKNREVVYEWDQGPSPSKYASHAPPLELVEMGTEQSVSELVAEERVSELAVEERVSEQRDDDDHVVVGLAC
ncbi:uncharacterized protein BDR25DRAFT_381291 [Lindgomyces ingoldianus]|uniref:Uncharacterized protein n=1 Tax=Lindgomyces ingoldianus TaxID=673940 RepID=A0ACB6QB96_9PLEO|nr:uncharacterized protein BDR25DRAFT_381291 [Lindgomyces ingoldianus]KAF2464208.1 hypothetical protein BDR25DRAFT_381291 [Lindgomyces ingoldianus]